MATEVEEFNINPQIIVQAFDVETTLEEFSLKDIEEFYIEYGGITDPLGQLSTAVMDFIEDVIATAQSAITSAISTLENTIRGIVSSLETAIKSAIDSVQSAILSAISGIQATIQSISSAIQNLPSVISSTIQSAIQSVISSIQSVISQIQSGFQSVVGAIQNITSTIQSIFQSVVSQIQSVVSQIQTGFQSVISTIQGLFTNIQQTLQNLATNITTTIQGVITQIQSGFQSIATTIQNIFTNIQQTLQNLITNVTSTIQSIASTIQTGFQSVITNIQGIFTNIQTFFQNVITQIITSFHGFSQTLQSMFSPVITAIDWIREQVGRIPQLPSLIWEHIKPFIQPLIDTIKDIPSKMVEISKAFQGFINPLVGIGQFFDQIRQKFIDFITSAYEWFSNAINWITKGWQGFVDWISKIPEHIQNLGSYIYENAIKPLQDWFNEHVTKPLSEAFKPVTDFFKGVWEELVKRWEGFVADPIGSISTFFKDVWNAISGAISWFVTKVTEFLGGLANTVVDVVKGITTNIFNATTSFLSSIAKGVVSGFWKTLTGMINASKSLWEQVGKFLSGIIEKTFETVYKNVAEPIEKAVMDLIKRITSGEGRGQIVETFGLLGVAMVTFIGSEYLARGLQITLRKLAGIFNVYQKRFTIRVRGRGEAKGEPAGVGAGASGGGGGGYTYTMTFNLGYPLRKIADEMEKYSNEYRRAMIYGMSIWACQPMTRLANSLWRNVLPVELPTLAELREITRRHMPIKEKFAEFLNIMRRYLSLYGYNDEVISWLTTPIKEPYEIKPTVGEWCIIVEDRFGQKRRIPISLLYEMPTPSDYVRMMIHDIIVHPDYFIQIMQMKGYNADNAMMYYLLHYRYPTLEKLWEFYCRAKANMLWIDDKVLPYKVTEEEGRIMNKYKIGKDPKYPAEFNASVNPEAPGKILDAIKLYAKWWDYFFASWIPDFTSDRMIMMDLMADIPLRIDARWMAKWMIPIPESLKRKLQVTKPYFNDEALMRVVTARGMHPDWVEPITIAEYMNALAEERTFARTGIINAFKEGFMPLDGLSKTLSHLTDVTILGKKVPVRFLEGEVKLLALRAKYDRALDILRDYFRDLLRGVTENIIPFDGMTKSLKEEVKAIAQALKLPNLALDEGYYKLYEPVAESLRKVRTVERIRYWYRYMLYRILYRFSEGYMSKEEFDKTIEEIATNAKLTDEEKQVFTEVAQLMYDGFYKKTKADGILHKVRRGVIDPKEAKKKLIELGLPEDLAEALIEKSTKIYTLSVSTLLSYAEYVDIPESFVRRKLEWMGVPEDEIPIILQVFRIRPLRDERAKMIRSVIDAYIDGYITKELLQKNLKELGKSPREIKILTEFADFEKSQATAKLAIDAILNRLRRGAITLEEAKKELSKYIVDKALIDAMIEKYVRTSVWSPDKLVSMAEYVPIDLEKLKEKAEMFGYPEEEVKLYPAYTLARNLNEEIGRIVTELVYLYVYDVIDEETLRKEIDRVRTLNGEIKKYGVDWIVIDDIEKELIVQRAKLRKLREQAKS